MIKTIEDNNILYAKIYRAGYVPQENEFYTREDDEIQFGLVSYKKDFKTGAHYHNHLKNKSLQTDEILFLQQGSARVDFFNDKGVYLKSTEIRQGDIIIIYLGGHNIVFYEDTKLFKIKSGAYKKDEEVTRMVGANNLELVIEN